MNNTLGNIVNEVQQLVLSSMREETDQLGTAVAANATTLTLATGDTLQSIEPGAILQIDYELFYVTSAPNTTDISVVPGFFGSTSTTHATNALITVNPRFPAVEIIRAINEELDDLCSPTNGLFQPAEITLSYNPAIQGYDLTDVNTNTAVVPSNFIDLLEVRVQEYGPSQKWPIIPLSKIGWQRQADTTSFPSGMSLTMDQAGYPGRPIRVQYKAAYNSALANATDNVLTVAGMHYQAQDIPALGAPYRLMNYRELKRSFTEAQFEPRRAQEVPVGSSLTALKGLMVLRAQRIDAERQRLNVMYRQRWQ